MCDDNLTTTWAIAKVWSKGAIYIKLPQNVHKIIEMMGMKLSSTQVKISAGMGYLAKERRQSSYRHPNILGSTAKYNSLLVNPCGAISRIFRDN